LKTIVSNETKNTVWIVFVKLTLMVYSYVFGPWEHVESGVVEIENRPKSHHTPSGMVYVWVGQKRRKCHFDDYRIK
jgi:16S rRNA A1518/A1519 N6-dimethyltransferase RsmA/KsgA/DIM1 with predicted DNA glycosylase/AP lyase activity